MPRSTAALPKPPTVAQIDRAIVAYETAMNAILDLTRRVAPESVAARPARAITDTAFDLHAQLAAFRRFMADEEAEGGRK